MKLQNSGTDEQYFEALNIGMRIVSLASRRFEELFFVRRKERREGLG